MREKPGQAEIRVKVKVKKLARDGDRQGKDPSRDQRRAARVHSEEGPGRPWRGVPAGWGQAPRTPA